MNHIQKTIRLRVAANRNRAAIVLMPFYSANPKTIQARPVRKNNANAIKHVSFNFTLKDSFLYQFSCFSNHRA